MVSAARNLPADPTNAAPLWELSLGSHQYSIPTIDRGRIFIAANDAGVERTGYKPSNGGLVMCVEQATGKLIWQLPSPRFLPGVVPPLHFDQWKCGICSGPVVEGNRVYLIGNRGEILCLDRDGQANGNDGLVTNELEYMGITNEPGARLEATDGDIIWQFNLLNELGIIGHDVVGSTLLLHGDYLYASTSNGIDDRHNKIPKPLAPTLIVLNKTTGRLVAQDDEKIGQRLLHCNWSSPCFGRVNGRALVFFGAGDGMLYAFETLPPGLTGAQVQTLKKVWSYDCNPPDYRVRDGVPVAYSKHNQNKPDGPSEVIGTPVFHNGRVYVTIGQSHIHGVGQGHLSCVDAASGRLIWGSRLVDRTTATVSIADGLLYVMDYTGNLHCFDADNGNRHWVHPMGYKTWCASTFVADGKVYAGTEANFMWVLKAGKEKEIISRGKFKTTPITPTAVDGVLYVPTQKSLIAIPGTPAAVAPVPAH
jgi:outer membrane protein assembly factor BamB